MTSAPLPQSPLRGVEQNRGQIYALKALEAPCQEARRSFHAWVQETGRARAAVEASARQAVADCYRFGLQALEDEAAFTLLCQRVGIRQTRSDRATNPFIRVIKAVFGEEIEDGTGGPPRWQWISDSQVNKYATVLLYAHQRGISGADIGQWLAEDWSVRGEPIPMSISRRLREAREALRRQPGALPSPSAKPALDANAILAAIDDLPEGVEVTPLTLSGLGAPDDASLILSLGEEDAVRLSHLPEDLLVQVLGTISRYYRRADPDNPPEDRPFWRLATLFRHGLPLLGESASVRVVNHQDHCAILMGGGSDGLILRAEIPALTGVPRRRVFALSKDHAKALVRVLGHPGASPQGLDGVAERFQETNFARPGGLLEQRVVLDGTDGPHSVSLLEIPDSAAETPLPGLPLGDFGITQWDAGTPLDHAAVAALARLDHRARQWKEQKQTRTGKTVTRRATRIFEVLASSQTTPPRLDLTLRRGGEQTGTLSLEVLHGPVRNDRISRSQLGAAAQVLLKRQATDHAVLMIAYGALWVLSGVNGKTGERITVGIPCLNSAGKAVGRGIRDARFTADQEPYGLTLRRAAQRLGFSAQRFDAPAP